MNKHTILSFLFLTLSIVVDGQKPGETYVSISIDASSGGRLKFLSDTTVELSSIQRHMIRSVKTVYKYKATDTAIRIYPPPIDSRENNVRGLHTLFTVSDTGIILIKIEGGFIDYTRSLIYVRHQDFGDDPDIAYIVNGKTYIQNAGVTDGYGLLRKKPKTNKALQKRLKGINKEDCTIEFVQGLNAYQRLGIKRVYGAFVITTRK